MRQLLIGHQQIDGAVGDVDQDAIAFLYQTNGTAGSCFRRGVTDGQARGTTREATVGQQGAVLAQALGLQVTGRVEHFLHARTALGTFVADDDDIAGLHFVGEDAAHRAVLAFKDLRSTFKYPDGGINTGGLDHAAIQRDVAVEHRQAAFLVIGMLHAADTAVFTVQIQGRPAGALAECGLGWDARRAGLVEGMYRLIAGLGNVPLGDRLGHGLAMDGRQIGVQQAATGQ